MSYQRSLRRESVLVRGSTCRGTILRESANLGLGTCQSGNCPDTNLSAKLSLKNCFKQLLSYRTLWLKVKSYQKDFLNTSVLNRSKSKKASKKPLKKQHWSAPIVKHPRKSLFKQNNKENTISKGVSQYRTQRIFNTGIPVWALKWCANINKNS